MLPLATALATLALGASSFESYVKSHNTPQFASRSTGTSSSLGDKTVTHRTFFDVTIDGADEIDGDYAMIKGGGGALLREKVVAAATDHMVVVVGPDKVVGTLGSTFDLPVEVVPFARAAVARGIRALGGDPRLREADGAVYLTDNGNEILDVHFSEGIADAAALELALDAIPGVVESGLFIGLARTLVVGHDDGSADLRKKGT